MQPRRVVETDVVPHRARAIEAETGESPGSGLEIQSDGLPMNDDDSGRCSPLCIDRSGIALR